MREHAAFRAAGRARGVKDARRRLRRDRRAIGGSRRRRQARGEILERDDLWPVRRLVHCRSQRVDPARQHHDQIDARVIDEVRDLARAVVGIDRHAACAERVHRELVQHVLGPAFEQQANAVTAAVASGGIAMHERADFVGCGVEADLVSLRVIRAARIRGHRQQRVTAVATCSGEERLAERRVVVDGDHGGVPGFDCVAGLRTRYRATHTTSCCHRWMRRDWPPGSCAAGHGRSRLLRRSARASATARRSRGCDNAARRCRA